VDAGNQRACRTRQTHALRDFRRDLLDAHAHPAAPRGPVLLQLPDDVLHEIRRDREADAEPPVGEKMAEFTPTTLPSMSNSGPPELPRLIGASVWMKSSYGPSWMSRFRAETIPSVTDPPSPNGLPIAITQSPTCAVSLSPNSTNGSAWLASTLSTARSALSSAPITLAGSRVPS